MIQKTDKIDKLKKSKKINVMIMSKSHAYIQTIYKIPAKFQTDWNKTVVGVALTKYPQVEKREKK